MPRGLPQAVKDNIEKCQMSAVAAVESYNRPGKRFRTEQYLVMITIAWTALFHAIFYRRNIKPWFKARNGRYIKIDGDPKHWDLTECLKNYFGGNNSPVRRNLEFLVGLRNKIEHRHLPELDVPLYGECQAALLNMEELLVENFGERYALMEQLAVSLQFSSITTKEKRKAARALATGAAKTVSEYVEKFRGSLPATVLNSMKYSFNVFLVPKVSNREKSADVAVEFIKVDEANEEDLKRLKKLNVLIKEKRIPIHNLDLLKPSQVVEKVNAHSTFKVTLNSHANAWRYFKVRPGTRTDHPERCDTQFCIYDEAHNDYLYTQNWVEKCIKVFSDRNKYMEITGREPVNNQRCI